MRIRHRGTPHEKPAATEVAPSKPPAGPLPVQGWTRTFHEFGEGLVSGRPRTSGAVALIVLLVTGVVWLVQHLTHWPGGYLPWMLDVVWFLGMVTFFLNFHQMRVQRDQAVTELTTRLDSVRNRVTMTGLGQSVVARPELQYKNYERQVWQQIYVVNASRDPIEFQVERFVATLGPVSSEPLDSEKTEGFIMPGDKLTWDTPNLDHVRVTDLNRQVEERGEVIIKYRHASDGPWFRYTQPFTVRTVPLDGDSWTHGVVILKGKHELVP
jgi:hypothetical protein